MLLSFSVENYKNFKEKQTLYLTVAENRSGKIKDKDKIDTNTFTVSDETFIKTAVIYGENGSGKSNLINAISFIKDFIIRPPLASMPDTFITTDIYLKSFKLDKDCINKPSNFEIEMLLNGLKYKYSFSVDNQKVYYEKLEQLNKGSNKLFYIYERNGQKIKFNAEKCKKMKDDTKNELQKLRANTLFISLLASINNEVGIKIYNFFTEKLFVFNSDSTNGVLSTKKIFEKDLYYEEKIIDFLNAVDINISNISIDGEIDRNIFDGRKNSVITNSKYLKTEGALSIKELLFNRLNNQGDSISFDFFYEESEGTRKMFNLAGDIIYTLNNGLIVFFDELDNKLHFKLIKFLIDLFNDKNINKKNAQLIFTSHNTTILNNKYDLFRRDQVYIINRKENEESELYSLADFGGIQKKISKEDLYIDDIVGGNPVVGRFTL